MGSMEFDQRAMRRSLRAHWAVADAETRAIGEAWYRVYGATAERLADGNRDIGAGVVAALSPRIRWDVNLRLARDLLRERPIHGVFRANFYKAERIRCGESPLDVLGGDKTRSFYANLAGDLWAVTVDVWAMRAAGLNRKSLTPLQYGKVATAYRAVAGEVGLLPGQFQAVVWAVARGRAD
jgi:hypothetical protein